MRISLRRHLDISAFAWLLCFLTGCTKNDTRAQAPLVVGYLPVNGIGAYLAGQPDLHKITHLDLAFVNPDSSGAVSAPDDIAPVIQLAHNSKVKVFMAIGGGNPPGYLKTILADNRQTIFINSLIALSVQYGFDGIDVDLEGDFIDGLYEGFVTRLAAALKSKNKLISAAIASAYAGSYTDKALKQFDWLNLMSYDRTGPWNPAKPGPHAPYQMAIDDLAYWTDTRGIPAKKLILGLPFYGYGFGNGAPESISYADIIAAYPAKYNEDQLSVPGGGIIYYNGAATIRAKANLASQKAGGVMIWQLLQDAQGDRSLLGIIDSILIHH